MAPAEHEIPEEADRDEGEKVRRALTELEQLGGDDLFDEPADDDVPSRAELFDPAPRETTSLAEPPAPPEVDLGELFEIDAPPTPRSNAEKRIELSELREALQDIQEEEELPASFQPDEVPRREAPRPAPFVADGAPAPSATPDPGRSRRLASALQSGIGAYLLVAVTLLTLVNAGVVVFSWKANAGLERTVRDFGHEVRQAADEILTETEERVREMSELAAPVVSLPPEHSRVFDEVDRAFVRGDYAGARERLYGLLAVVDRLDETVRDDTEARARYLVADSFRLEAETRAAQESAQ